MDPSVWTTPYIGDVVSVVPHHNLNPEPMTLHIIPVPLHLQDHMEEIPFYKESEVRLRSKNNTIKLICAKENPPRSIDSDNSVSG